MRYTFEFKLFGSKVQMFDEGRMGIVIEKEDVQFAILVCIQFNTSI